jgi:hypothetical protein
MLHSATTVFRHEDLGKRRDACVSNSVKEVCRSETVGGPFVPYDVCGKEDDEYDANHYGS